MIRWGKSSDGFVRSHCRHWSIVPLFCGRSRAQWFELRCDDVVVEGMLATHRDAKDAAEAHCEKARGISAVALVRRTLFGQPPIAGPGSVESTATEMFRAARPEVKS
jgi:hypothetical protein